MYILMLSEETKHPRKSPKQHFYNNNINNLIMKYIFDVYNLKS